jgi:hypothetical protein
VASKRPSQAWTRMVGVLLLLLFVLSVIGLSPRLRFAVG